MLSLVGIGSARTDATSSRLCFCLLIHWLVAGGGFDGGHLDRRIHMLLRRGRLNILKQSAFMVCRNVQLDDLADRPEDRASMGGYW